MVPVPPAAATPPSPSPRRPAATLPGVRTPTDPARRLLYPLTFAAVAGVCLRYAAGGGAWLALLWPAAAFAGVAAIYILGRPGWLGKRADGSRDPLAAALFAPYTLFALAGWHAHRLLKDGGRAWDRVGDALYLSRRPLGGELPPAVAEHPDAVVLDLTAEFRDPAAVRDHPGYRCEPVLDAAAPPAADLARIVAALPPPGGPPVLIHCANGRGRTGLVAAAYLLQHGLAADPAAAVRALRAARPAVRLLPRQRAVLDDFAAGRRSPVGAAGSGVE